jgi:TetR/AcrR family transcriptional repressor of nem operon
LTCGFNGCGVQEIADAATIPKGSFYSYFKTKEQFAVAAIEAYWENLERRFGAVLVDTALSPIVRISRFFKMLSDDKARSNFAFGCLIGNLSLEISNGSPLVRAMLADIYERWETLLVVCLHEAQVKGEIGPTRDLRDLASALIECWEGAAMRAKVEQKRRPYRRFEQAVLPNLLRA